MFWSLNFFVNHIVYIRIKFFCYKSKTESYFFEMFFSLSLFLDDSPIACKPRSTVYSLPYNEAFTNYPSCFELSQCGGCCSSLPGHVCAPTELHVEKKQFIRIYYVGGKVFL